METSLRVFGRRSSSISGPSSINKKDPRSLRLNDGRFVRADE